MRYDMVPAADLVEDFGIYPREDVDSTNVSRIAEALRADQNLVLRVVADRKSKRIIDGFHTRRAYMRVYGKDCLVPVEWRDYEKDSDLYADACRLNAKHGKAITGSALTHALLRGIDNGLDEASLAEIFGIRVQKVSEIVKLRVGIVRSTPIKDRSVKKASTVPQRVGLKNSVRHLYGTEPKLTKGQAAALDSAPGTAQWLMIKQVADFLEEGFIDWSDDRVVTQIDRLEKALQAHKAHV